MSESDKELEPERANGATDEIVALLPDSEPSE